MCTATGVAFSATNIRKGGDLSMRAIGCVSQQLNAELLYLSNMYCFRMGKFSSVGAQGKFVGVVGGNVRRGHWHGASSGPATPVFEQG